MPGQPRKMTRHRLSCLAAVLLIVLGVNAVSAVVQVAMAKKTLVSPPLPPPGDTVVSSVGGSIQLIVAAGGITVSAAVADVTSMHFTVADPQGQIVFAERSDGTPMQWSLSASALDGLYIYEVRIIAGAQSLREAGRVRAESGVLLPSTHLVWGRLNKKSRLQTILDNTNTVSGMITEEGGVLSTQAADGIQYTLTIPPNALAATAEIALTPLISMSGIPMSSGVVAAVRLEPDGLVLLEPANLSIEFLATPPTGILGFLLPQDADTFQLSTVQTNGNMVSLSIDHFSDGGAIDPEDIIIAELERTLLAMYFGRGGIVETLSSGPSCTALLGGIADRVLEFAFLTDFYPDGPGDQTFEPIPCVVVPGGADDPFRCENFFDLRDAALQSLRNVTGGAFETADNQCLGGDASAERVAFQCIKLAEDLQDGVGIFAGLPDSLIDQKTCGIKILEVAPDSAAAQLLVGQSGEPALEGLAKDSEGNILEGRELVWGSLDEAILSAETADITASGGTAVSVSALSQGDTHLLVIDKLAADVGVRDPVFREFVIVDVIDFTGPWLGAVTATDNECFAMFDGTTLELEPAEIPSPVVLNLVQTERNITTPEFPAASAEVSNFDQLRVTAGDPPYIVSFSLGPTAQHPDCDDFFTNTGDFLEAPEFCAREGCQPLFCEQTVIGEGSLDNSGQTVEGDYGWREEIRYTVLFLSDPGSSPVTVTELCQGRDTFRVSR
jgi:hypothetical protein